MATKPTYPFYVSNTAPNHDDLIALYMFYENTGSTINNLIDTKDSISGQTYDILDAFAYDSLNTVSSSKWVTASEGFAIKTNTSTQNDDYVGIGNSKYIKSAMGSKGTVRIRFDNTSSDTSVNQCLWSTNTPTFTTGSVFRLFRLSSNGKMRIVSSWFSTTDSSGVFAVGLHDLFIMWDDNGGGTGFFKIIDVGSGLPVTLIDITTSGPVSLSTTNDTTEFSGMMFGAEYVSSAVNNETTNYNLYLAALYSDTLDDNAIGYFASNPYSVVQTSALVDPPKADYITYPVWMKCNGSSTLPVLKNNSLTSGVIASYVSSKGSGTTITDLGPNPADASLTNSGMWEMQDRGYRVNANYTDKISVASNKFVTGNSSSFTTVFLTQNPTANAADSVMFEKTNSSRTKGFGIIHDASSSWNAWIDNTSHYCSLPEPPGFGYSLWTLRYTYNASGGSYLSFWKFDWTSNEFVKATDLVYTATTQTTASMLDMFIACGKDAGIADTDDCGFLMFTMWDRALSESELNEIGNDPFCIYEFPKGEEIKFHIAGHRLGAVDYDVTRETINCSLYLAENFASDGQLIVSIHGTRSDNEVQEMGISDSIVTNFGGPHWGTIAELYDFAVLCPRVFTSGSSLNTDSGSPHYGTGPQLQNNILDEDRILLVLECLENNELTSNFQYYITGHSSGASLCDTIAARNPEMFPMVCSRHGTGFSAGDELIDGDNSAEHYTDQTANSRYNRYCWTADNINGPFVKGTPYSTTNNQSAFYQSTGSYDITGDPIQKSIKRLIINAEFDGSPEDAEGNPISVNYTNPSGGFPVGQEEGVTNTYSWQQDIGIEYLGQFGFENIRQVVYTPPISLSSETHYDAPFVCERTDATNYPHFCHDKARDLAGAFFAFGFSYFFGSSDDIVLNIIADVGTKITLSTSDPDAVRTAWEFTLENGEVFTITTDGTTLTSPNIISSSISYIHIWLPPFHKFTVRVRQYVNSEWSPWLASSEFISQGFLNSYDRYKLLTQQSTSIPDDGSGTSGRTYVDGVLVDDGLGTYGTTLINEEQVDVWPQPEI